MCPFSQNKSDCNILNLVTCMTFQRLHEKLRLQLRAGRVRGGVYLYVHILCLVQL